MKLSRRALEVLSSVVQEYILTGDPVGSKKLVQQYGLEQSSATVRNVMAALEDQGFLLQPHTSAGRVPTDQGLRLYVDRLMQWREITPAQRQEIRARYDLSNMEVQELLREVSRILADLSKHCALVLVPRSESSVLKRIEFLPLRKGKMIAVLLMETGILQNRMLEISEELSASDLVKIHNYLNELCDGRELHEVRRLVRQELERQQDKYDRLVSQALDLGSRALAGPSEDQVLVEGQSRLLDHSKGFDPEELKAVLRAVDEKEQVLKLLDETARAERVQVFIGAETGGEQMRGCSVVASAYGDHKTLGTLGVIGPSSMNYSHIIPLVDFTADILTAHLRGV